MAETVHPEKSNKLENTVRYGLNAKQQPVDLLDNEEVLASNNLTENVIRPYTLGQKG